MTTILVTGDFLIDHHIYEGRRHHFGDQRSPGVCVTEELGGAALVHHLLQELQSQTSGPWKSRLAVDEQLVRDRAFSCPGPGTDCQEQPFAAYAFWRPFPIRGKTAERRWRVAEAMGFGGGPASTGEWPWKPAADLTASPAVLVISDGGMGFRSRMNVAQWRVPVRDARLLELLRESAGTSADQTIRQIPETEPGWILLKMSAPVGEGDLWRELSEFHADRLVVVVAARELRRAGVRLAEGLSWEQTLEDLHTALPNHPGLHALTRCRHLIISFDGEAVLWLRRAADEQYVATFLFDPAFVEGEQRNDLEGSVYGHLSCLTALIAAELAAASADLDLTTAMSRGLSAMESLREHGHGDASRSGAGFPAASLAQAAVANIQSDVLQVRTFPFHSAACPIQPGWSLLALHETPEAGAAGVPLNGIARRVLIQGPGALRSPTLRIGDFFTADRSEIEALRSLRQLVNRYVADRKADKPLSIGVFGPPGAGKSFAVRELATSLLRDRLGWLEFNLSQFNGPTDLIGALHQVRDKILEGKTPVAFFDEFDSRNLVWLKYLLAPMQDGRFQEGQLSHPVGQCLFVFAGGTSHTFEAFEARGCGAGTPGHELADQFVLAKGPDFASRLDGKLNVIGPNPRMSGAVGSVDIFCPVRRALFIRSRLRCGDHQRLRIHPGLATALLELDNFRHGSRSLTKLLEPFRIQRRTQPDADFSLSALPPRDQLALHVNSAEFDALVRRDEGFASALGVDTLAAAVHSFYRSKGKSEGWIKTHHDREFHELPPFDQASNRAAARRIPAVLALGGMRLVPGKASADERKLAESLLAFHADLLGEAEHDGWMDWHVDNGWSRAEPRNDARMLHNLIVPYAELREKEQRKDRDAVSHYAEIADLAGMKIVRC